MINSIKITNHLGETITLEMRFPEKSGFLIRNIDGLGPPKANINTSELAAKDGSIFESARTMARNIVLFLNFLHFPTIEQTRLNSYKFFPIKRKVRITIESDTRVCLTEGYIESNEPDIFSSQEGSNISILCPDSYLYSDDIAVTSFSTVDPLFQFPFANNSLTDPLLEQGDINLNTERNIPYYGDVPIGFTAYIKASGAVHDLRITNSKSGEYIELDGDKIDSITGSDIVDGDNIIISTVRGNKFVLLQRGATFYNILNALGKNPVWFELDRGDNIFVLSAANGIENLELRIENQVAYEGI